MVGGETSPNGGFIVQAGQKCFVVQHCSSSGVIQAGSPQLGGGGMDVQEIYSFHTVGLQGKYEDMVQEALLEDESASMEMETQ